VAAAAALAVSVVVVDSYPPHWEVASLIPENIY
jgi:hypothetical protein